MSNVIYGILDKEEMKTFMEPSEIEYPFDFLGFMNQKNNKSDYLMQKKISLYASIYSRIFGADFNGLKSLALNAEPVLAYDKDMGWTISITPNSIINDILKLVGSKTRVDNYYMPVDNSMDLETQHKKYVLKVLQDELNTQFSCRNKEILQMAINNIDYILKYSYIDLDRKGDIVTKSLAYYMAVDCLDRMKNGNNLLCDFPNTYYSRVSKVGSSQWPCTTWYKGAPYFTYAPYNELYESMLKKDVKMFQKPTKANVYHILDSLSFLPSGKIDKGFMEIKTSKGKVRFNADAILARMQENEKRMRFYEKFDRKEAFIASGEGLEGYFGYVFPNNYIVFDKFFTSSKTRYPAKENAIYIMPADKFLLSEVDKQFMMKLAKTDPTIMRYYHAGDWESRVKEVFNMPDISKEDFEDVVAKYQMETGKKIILRG